MAALACSDTGQIGKQDVLLVWFWQSPAVGRGRVLVASTYRQSEKDVEKGFKAQKYEGNILEDLDVIFL